MLPRWVFGETAAFVRKHHNSNYKNETKSCKQKFNQKSTGYLIIIAEKLKFATQWKEFIDFIFLFDIVSFRDRRDRKFRDDTDIDTF